MKIGEWVAYSEYGMYVNCITGETTFRTKQEAINSVGTACLDSASKPRVKRVNQGDYRYTPKDCDTGKYGTTYNIVRITSENIEEYKEMEENLEREAEEG